MRVLIADDHPLLREAMISTFKQYPDIQVVAEAVDGEAAVKLSAELKPDIVVMDIVMPKLNGIDATKQIKKLSPNTAVLILTAYDDDRYVIGLLESGAVGYLLKSAPGRVLVDAIRAVYQGESVLNPEIIAKLLKYGRQKQTAENHLKPEEQITNRELEVLKLVAQGMSNKDIAKTLFLSTRTIKAHLASIFSKMEVASRTEAIIKGVREGWLVLDSTPTDRNKE